MNTAPNATTPDQIVWPLPATSLPHAHLTWSEYMVWQATHLANPPATVQSIQLSSLEIAQSSIHVMSSSPAQRSVWPLPATQLPNTHLTWAEWIAQQAARTNRQQPESVRHDRAA